MSGRAVEFVQDEKMIRWCPLGAILLGGEQMGSLNLSKSGALEEFGRLLIRNEVACPRCFEPYHCTLEKLAPVGVVPRIRCQLCNFLFTWYAAEANFLVYERLSGQQHERLSGQQQEFDPFYPDEQRPEDVYAEDSPRSLNERLSDFRCPICTEALLHAIRYRAGFARVVCRNAGCRQQWGFRVEQDEAQPAELAA